MKRRLTVLPILALVGLGLSLALTYIHVRVHLDPTYTSLCAVGKTLNCETVAASGYAVFMGVPLSVLGALYYLLFGGIALAQQRRHRLIYPGMLCAVTLAGAIVSILLFVLSSFVIKALCLLCMATYAVNLALFFVMCALTKSEGRVIPMLRADIAAVRHRPMVWIQAAALAGLLITAGPLGGFPRYWEMASWRSGAVFANGVDANGLPWLGAENPAITVVEYLDFECPACRAAHKKLRRMLSRAKDTLRIVRHDMPRVACVDKSGGFESRCAVARAAYCAGRDGRYWDFNDAVISHPKPMTGSGRASFELELAVRLGFDRKAFAACMAAPDTVAHVQSLYQSGRREGVRYTPAYRVGEKTAVGLSALVSLLPSSFTAFRFGG